MFRRQGDSSRVLIFSALALRVVDGDGLHAQSLTKKRGNGSARLPGQEAVLRPRFEVRAVPSATTADRDAAAYVKGGGCRPCQEDESNDEAD